MYLSHSPSSPHVHSLVELCKTKPAPANSAIRSLGEWLLENNPRRLAAAKAEEARSQQQAQIAALESKQKEEEDRLKVLPNQGRVVPQEGARKSRIVFTAPGVTDAVIQSIADKHGYTVLAVPAAADGAVATFKEVYADLKMRMNKAANHKFLVSIGTVEARAHYGGGDEHDSDQCVQWGAT